MYTLWIYSKRQGKWIPLAKGETEKDLDQATRVAQEYERAMPWAVVDQDGLRYWRKGDSPEAILQGIAEARGVR